MMINCSLGLSWFRWKSIYGLALVLFTTAAVAQTITHGTTFAVERTPTMVAVAIDSSEAAIDSVAKSNSHMHPNHSACKIHATSAGIVFITAGVATFTSKDGKQRIDLHRVIGDILSRLSMPTIDITAPLRTQLIPWLTMFAETNVGKNYWHEGANMFEIVVAGSQNNVPFVADYEFVLHRAGQNVNLTLQKHNCPGPDCPKGYYKIAPAIGEFRMTGNAVLDTETRLNRILSSGDKHYAGPIQLLTISQSGQLRWVHKPDFCPMIPNY